MVWSFFGIEFSANLPRRDTQGNMGTQPADHTAVTALPCKLSAAVATLPGPQHAGVCSLGDEETSMLGTGTAGMTTAGTAPSRGLTPGKTIPWASLCPRSMCAGRKPLCIQTLREHHLREPLVS